MSARAQGFLKGSIGPSRQKVATTNSVGAASSHADSDSIHTLFAHSDNGGRGCAEQILRNGCKTKSMAGEPYFGQAANVAEVAVSVFRPGASRYFNVHADGAAGRFRDYCGQKPVVHTRGRTTLPPDMAINPGIAAHKADGGTVACLDLLEDAFGQFDSNEAMAAVGQIHDELAFDDR